MRGTVEIGDPSGADITAGELIDGLEATIDAKAAIGPINRNRPIEACVIVAGQRYTVAVQALRINLEET